MTTYRVRLDGSLVDADVIKGIEAVASEFPGPDPIECRIVAGGGRSTLTLATHVDSRNPDFRRAVADVVRAHRR